MTPKDKLGNDISVGDFIVYGHALGRCAGLRIGKVLAIKHKEPTYYGQSPWSIRVQGIDDDWRAPTLCRPGTLQFPERIIVLSPSYIPTKLYLLLEGH